MTRSLMGGARPAAVSEGREAEEIRGDMRLHVGEGIRQPPLDDVQYLLRDDSRAIPVH